MVIYSHCSSEEKTVYEDFKEPRYISQEYSSDGVWIP
jgi:hypothetical protein